jgi:hypothetical protein
VTLSTTPVDNGINLQALLDAREALSASPEAAEFEWRATSGGSGGSPAAWPSSSSQVPTTKPRGGGGAERQRQHPSGAAAGLGPSFGTYRGRILVTAG